MNLALNISEKQKEFQDKDCIMHLKNKTGLFNLQKTILTRQIAPPIYNRAS